MSSYPIPIPSDATARDAGELVERFAFLAERAIPRSVDWDAPALTFDPDLTAQEVATLDRLRIVARASLRLTPGEFEAIAAEAPTLRAYLTLNSPTNAQSVAAIKGIIRVLRAILRD